MTLMTQKYRYNSRQKLKSPRC